MLEKEEQFRKRKLQYILLGTGKNRGHFMKICRRFILDILHCEEENLYTRKLDILVLLFLVILVFGCTAQKMVFS